MKRAAPRRKSKHPEAIQAAPWQPSIRICAALLLATIAVFAIIRFRLRDIPLERDEGEYAYAGQLMLQGIPPYQLAYNMKLPGTYAAYALLMAVFGQTSTGIHLGLLLVNAATILLMYFLAARLFGKTAGLVAAASYGLLSTSASVLGLTAHATHFVVISAVAGLLVLLRALDHKNAWLFFLSGFFVGLAFVMKQPGILFAIFAGIYLLRCEWLQTSERKHLLTRFGIFALGVVLPYGLTCFVLWRFGVFGKFWFWTFSYARHYGLGFADGFQELCREFPLVFEPSVFVWLIAAVGITAFWWDAKARQHALFCLGLLTFSFLAVCPGFVFTSHYFILILPAVSLLVSVAVSSVTSLLSKRYRKAFLRATADLAFLVAVAISLFGQRELLFKMDPVTASAALYGMNPFREAVKIAEYLRGHSDASSRIAVLGSEPEVYFYAHRHSATGYIYTYALMEDQPYALTMQQEMISEIESVRPEFIVAVNVPMSWNVTPESERHIISWIQPYIDGHYDRVGIADIQSEDHTEYRWDEESLHYQPSSSYSLLVFRRKA